jgi:hypothetical protein
MLWLCRLLTAAVSVSASGEASWRVPIIFQAIFSIGLLCTVMQLPESPRWLIKMGRDDEARLIFAALADVPDDDESVALQVEGPPSSRCFLRGDSFLTTTFSTEIRATLPLVEGGALRDVFTMGKERHFHRACLGYWNQVMQQITG